MSRDSVEPGDVFVKPGLSPIRWSVERMFDYTDIPPHVRLISLNDGRRTITVALSTLLDPRQFRREST